MGTAAVRFSTAAKAAEKRQKWRGVRVVTRQEKDAMLEKGYLQVYTGDGKGKTTAALGLALRALCAGHRVFFGQFLKGRASSELRAAARFPELTVEQFGGPDFVRGKPSEEAIARARAGLRKMEEVLASGVYDVVIFDEVNCAASLGLLTPGDVLAALAKRSDRTEVILTGRDAPRAFVDAADLVTEMKEIRHYYCAGVLPRVGIEE
jgi:cob(I)alamin adenosyltransferase